MTITLDNLRDVLRRYMHRERVSHNEVARRISKRAVADDERVSTPTVVQFLSNPRRKLHARTQSAIVHLLKDEGYLTGFGIPTEKAMPQGGPDTETDVPMLEAIGFSAVPYEPPTNGNREMDAMQNDWENALLVAAIVAGPAPESVKKRQLKSILPDLFPHL